MSRAVIRAGITVLIAGLLTVAGFAGDTVAAYLDVVPKSMAEEQPGYTQCQLGSVCADGFRLLAEADIALINVGDLRDDLPQGQVTRQDIRDVFPNDRELALARVTPSQLYALLEQSVSRAVLDSETEQVDEAASKYDGFCQISGITLRYDVSAPPGQRILEVSLSDGTSLSPEDDTSQLTLCGSMYMFEGGYGFPETEAEPLGITQTQALEEYIAPLRALTVEDPNRIIIVGARQSMVLGAVPRELVFVGALLLCVLLVLNGRKFRRYQDEYGNIPVGKYR